MNDSRIQLIKVGTAEAAVPVKEDARAGLPSASRLEQIMLCPGSWRAQQGLAEEPREDALVGRRIHQWLAGARPGLSDEEQAIADACRGQQERLARRLWGEAGGGAAAEYAERRFWLHDDRRAAAMSGQVDYAVVRGRRALLVDYKTGHGRVTPAARNPQLLALAVMLAEAHEELEEVTGAIVQPAVSGTPQCGVFDAPSLTRSRALILEALEAARRPDAPCHPGDRQCQYCRAKARCAAAGGMVETLATVPARGLAGAASREPLAEPVSNEQLSLWLERCGAAEDVIAALRAEARRRIEAGQGVPGWRLVPGVLRERVVDVPGLAARLAAQGVAPEAFLAGCAVTKLALKALLKEKTGAKGLALETALDALLDGLTEAKPTAPQLARA